MGFMTRGAPVIRTGRALPRRLLVVAAAALLPVMAGCEAGDNAPTLQFHYPTQGAGTVVGHIAIRNVFVIGAPLGQHLAIGQSAGLYLALVNNGPDDRLVSVSAPGTATSVALPSSPIPLGATPVLLQGPAPQVFLTGLVRPLINGQNINVTLTFKNAGSVTLAVPVIARSNFWATYSPAPAPSATPTSTPSPHGRHAHRHRHPSSPSVSPSPSSSST
jgi:copper(I)-binding protein